MISNITISGKQYKIKQTIRSLFLFEEITGKPFEIKNTLDNYLYFFCMIIANNPNCSLTWDSFIDCLDNDPTIITQLNQVINDQQKIDKLLDNGEEKDGKKKD